MLHDLSNRQPLRRIKGQHRVDQAHELLRELSLLEVSSPEVIMLIGAETLVEIIRWHGLIKCWGA